MSNQEKDKSAKFISLSEAFTLLKGAGVNITRPTLKQKLLTAAKEQGYIGIIIQTSPHSWMKIKAELFQKWQKEMYYVGEDEEEKNKETSTKDRRRR